MNASVIPVLGLTMRWRRCSSNLNLPAGDVDLAVIATRTLRIESKNVFPARQRLGKQRSMRTVGIMEHSALNWMRYALVYSTFALMTFDKPSSQCDN